MDLHLVLLLQGVSMQSLNKSAVEMSYFQSDGIPRELRLCRNRFTSLPSATMLAVQIEAIGEDDEDESDARSGFVQQQQGLA